MEKGREDIYFMLAPAVLDLCAPVYQMCGMNMVKTRATT